MDEPHPKQHCCDYMTRQVNSRCDMHPDPFDCVDSLIFYSAKFNEYGIIFHDGGRSTSCIDYCPWCGVRLPESQRDLWYETMERLGLDDAEDEQIPAEYLTDEWYATKSVAD